MMTLSETEVIGSTTADYLDYLATSISRLGVLDLASAAGPSTWSMPSADHCRRRLMWHRDRIVALTGDLRHRAAQLRLENVQSHRHIPR